jgi:hypothetical protein
MKKPNKLLKELGVGRSVVKYHAHALTMFAVFWSLPSGIIIFALVIGFHEIPPLKTFLTFKGIVQICALLAVPGIHLLSIIGAIYYWCTERKQKVTVLKTKGEICVGM